MSNYYKPKSWNAICDVCGVKFKEHQLTKRWDGVMVCSDDYETRHPQDLIRVPRENPTVPWSRPEVSESFVNTDAILTEVSFNIFTETETLLSLTIEDTSQEFIMTQDFDFFTTEDGYLLEQE